MVSPFHARVKRVFYQASRRPLAARAAFLDDACRHAAGVRAEVESLLSFHREGSGRLVAGATRSRRFRQGRVVGGRYRIAGCLGRGGVGEVYRAWDLSLETWVALKVLIVSNRLGRAELLREVRVARQVTHPAVCRVYDIGEADGETFLTMEWIQGERLDALLRRHGRMAPGRVVKLVRELCAGLATAHEKGIVHRDLKPGNVLIDRLGHPHLTDFGTAVLLWRPTVRDLLPIGTPRYMAPEQVQEGGEITARTDVYALGLLLHEALTGIRPEPGRQPSLLPLRAVGVDPRLLEVVRRALSPDPQDRHGSAEEMGRDLSFEAAPDVRGHFRMMASDDPALQPEGLCGASRAGEARFGATALRLCGAFGSSGPISS